VTLTKDHNITTGKIYNEVRARVCVRLRDGRQQQAVSDDWWCG
jgi:CTP synthase (UTP-ammonia lyase)